MVTLLPSLHSLSKRKVYSMCCGNFPLEPACVCPPEPRVLPHCESSYGPVHKWGPLVSQFHHPELVFEAPSLGTSNLITVSHDLSPFSSFPIILIGTKTMYTIWQQGIWDLVNTCTSQQIYELSVELRFPSFIWNWVQLT